MSFDRKDTSFNYQHVSFNYNDISLNFDDIMTSLIYKEPTELNPKSPYLRSACPSYLDAQDPSPVPEDVEIPALRRICNGVAWDDEGIPGTVWNPF